MSEGYASSDAINVEIDKLYPVDKIVDKRIKKGKVEYRVRWKNYSPDTDSWEPSKSLHDTCGQLIKDFNKKYKSLKSNGSIPTSAESSSDVSIFHQKISDKVIKNGSNTFDRTVKSSTNCTTTKFDIENGSLKHKSKENCKSSISLNRNYPENHEKRQINNNKINHGSDSVENCKNVIKPHSKDTLNSLKVTTRENNRKNIDSDRSIDQQKDHKKFIYLEDNEIDEPCVPNSKTSSINGIVIRKFNSPIASENRSSDKKSNETPNKSVPDIYSLKRKPISLIIGNQKKTKLSDKESKINPISIYENDQIQNLKKIINSNSNYLQFNFSRTPSFSKPHLISEEKMEKHLKNLPFQRYKESEHVENCDASEGRRTSIRQIEATNRFREIIVRKNVHAGFTEICLHNNSHSFPNCFNTKILTELHIALKQAINDSSRVILLSAVGSVFSSGIDLETIISSPKYNSNLKNLITTAQPTNPVYPNQQIIDLAESLKKFLLELLHFPKPIVVGINGPAIGLGCAILPLCDLIYATESASFCLPYTNLSQTPEAGSSLTLPMLVGMPTANQLLLCGRKWSAKEALSGGLISEIIFSDKFKAELFSRCEKLAHIPSMSVETTKCMIRIHYKEQIDLTINMECKKLLEIWKSNEFRISAQSFIDNELPNLLL